MLKPNRGAEALASIVARPKHTQSSLADACNCSSSAVAQWLNGIAKPRMEHREILEREIGIPVGAWDEALDEQGAA